MVRKSMDYPGVINVRGLENMGSTGGQQTEPYLIGIYIAM